MDTTEARLRAKLPGADTGIELRRTMCDICTPGMQCGVDAYVRDGRILKLEGTADFPSNNGRLCTRGAAGRQYLYRADRIRTPMKRSGPRGSGAFEPIGWDEALALCAEALKKQREADPDGAVFLTGYPKWYRPLLHRLAHAYGTRNYLTESSTCHQAEVMSYKALFGTLMRADLGRARTVIAWGLNAPVNSVSSGNALFRLRESGGTIVVIDPRYTQSSERLAGLCLRPKNGTDAALAHAMANWMFQNRRQNQAFLDRYVSGVEDYRRYVSAFSPERAAALCGVDAADIVRAAELLCDDPTGVIVPGNALTHRVNGFNTHRAVLSLLVLLGRVDCPGGLRPVNESLCHSDGGFASREEEFIQARRPGACKPPVGSGRFPLWAEMVDEGQAMDLIRQMESGTPYPLRTLACFGVNDRMYPESPRLLRAMDGLDFSFAVDLFWTDVCRHADVVLPACSSYERGEAKCYAGRYVNWTRPAVEPLYDSRPDADFLCELSRRLGLNDPLLDAGYDACAEYILAPSGITDWEAVRDAPLPTPAPNAKGYEEGSYLRAIPKPGGRIELSFSAAARHGLAPLPVWEPPEADPEHPFVLMAGARLPNTIHSRCHEVPWLRSLRPEPLAELCHADARRLGVAEGDWLTIESRVGSLTVRAHLTETAREGELLLGHGYREANANALMPLDHLDPYTGFPGYKELPCALRRAEKEAP